jgi:aminoglycoside phosphotransferase (APT) family kinase protein
MAVAPAVNLESNLLGYLRVQLHAPDLVYGALPERFPTGVENRVYGLRLVSAPAPFDGPLVMRLYGAMAEPGHARIEAAVQNAVAEQGFPAPAVVHVCEDESVLGGQFILMQRLPGQVMLEVLATTDAGLIAPIRNWRGLLFRMPEVVAGVMASLHALNPDLLLERLAQSGAPRSALSMESHLAAIAERIDRAGLDVYRDGIRWLIQRAPAEPARLAICHGDLWFGNVLELHGRVTGLVDWSRISARVADPAYDVGASSVVLAGGMADIPAALRLIGRIVQRGMAQRFIRAYQERLPVDLERAGFYQLVRCIDYLSYVAWRRNEPTARARAERDMLDIPGSTEGLRAIFLKGTGISLPMPPAPHRSRTPTPNP